MIYGFEHYELDTARYELLDEGVAAPIEPQVFSVLAYLVEHAGEVVTKERLLDEVWGDRFVSESALTSRIKAARKAVGDDGTKQRVIRTVHGRGYEFIASVTRNDGADPTRPSTEVERGHSIPAGVTQLVGRASDLVQLRQLIDTTRLLTLVGPGGVGKTSLAYELARTEGSKFANGVWVVELLSITDPAAAIGAVATTLDVQTRQGRSLTEAVVDVLAPLNALVVLDNLEHVIEPISELVSQLLRQAPGVTVLATGREALRITGEQLWHVEPLPINDAEVLTDNAELVAAGASAVALFVKRAQAIDPAFLVSEQTIEQVTQICTRLDGMPLAIELAAARTTSFDVTEINDRLDERFRILRGSRRDTDPRHTALRDSFSWSYEMLDSDQRKIFDRLSVFVGPFGLQGVEAVCDAGDIDVIETLSDLVDRSMVTARRRPGRARYELLETLRAYGAENLDESETAGLRDRHAAHYLDLAGRAGIGLNQPDEGRWSTDVDDAFANLRAAHTHLLSCGAVGQAMALIDGIREHAMRAMRYEVMSWAEATLLAPGAADEPLHASIKGIAAYGNWIRGEFDLARSRAVEVQAEEAAAGGTPSGHAERVLGNVDTTFGNLDDATAVLQKLKTDAEASGSPARTAHAYYMHSLASWSLGDAAAGTTSAAQAMEVSIASDNPTAIAGALVADGFAHIDDPAHANESFGKAEEIAASAGNRWMSGFARSQLTLDKVRRGDVSDDTRRELSGLIDLWFRAGDWGNQWPAITMAVLALAQLESDVEAAQLIGALDRHAVVGPPPLPKMHQALIGETVEAIRERLGGDRFDALSEQGALRPVSDLVALAQASLAP